MPWKALSVVEAVPQAITRRTRQNPEHFKQLGYLRRTYSGTHYPSPANDHDSADGQSVLTDKKRKNRLIMPGKSNRIESPCIVPTQPGPSVTRNVSARENYYQVNRQGYGLYVCTDSIPCAMFMLRCQTSSIAPTPANSSNRYDTAKLRSRRRCPDPGQRYSRHPCSGDG